MGALSFNYSVFPNPETSTKFFEYRKYSQLTEYRLKYERYATLSDASIFNAPVAVTKVATGVRLYDLFATEKKAKDVAYFKGYRPVYSVHPMRFINNSIYTQRIIRTSQYDDYITLWHPNIKYGHMQDLFNTERIKDKDFIFNKINSVTVHFNNIVHENHQYSFIPPNWSINTVEFKMEHVLDNNDKTRLISHFIINRNPRHINTTMNLSYTIERTKAGWEIYRSSIVNRVNHDILSPFSNIFVQMHDYKNTDIYSSGFMKRTRKLYIRIYENLNAYKENSEIPFLDNEILIESFLKEVSIFSPVNNVFSERKSLYREPEKILTTPRTKEFVIFDKILELTPERKGLDIFKKVFNVYVDREFLNILKFDTQAESVKGFRFTKRSLNVSKDSYDFNILRRSINMTKDNFGFSILKDNFVDKILYEQSLFPKIYGVDKDYSNSFGIMLDPYDAIKENKSLPWLDDILFCCKPRKGIMFSNAFQIYQVRSDMNNSHFNFIPFITEQGFDFRRREDLAKNDRKEIYRRDFDDFIVKENKYAISDNSTLTSSAYNYLDSIHDVWTCSHGKAISEFTDSIYNSSGSSKSTTENILDNVLNEKSSIHIIEQEDHGEKNNNILSYYQFVSLNDNGRHININHELFSLKDGKETELSSKENISFIKKFYLFSHEECFASSSDIRSLELYDDYNIIFGGLPIKHLSEYDYSIGTPRMKHLSEYDYAFLNDPSVRHLSGYDYAFLESPRMKHLSGDNGFVPIYKNNFMNTVWLEQIFVDKGKHSYNTYVFNSDDIFLEPTSSITTNVYLDNIFCSTGNNHFSTNYINTQDSVVTKKEQNLSIFPGSNISIHDTNKDVTQKIFASWFVYRDRHGMMISDSQQIIQKIRHSMVIYPYSTNIYKDRKGISLYDTNLLQRKKRLISIYNNIEPIHREDYETSVDANFEGIIRNIYPVAVSHYLKYPSWEALGGFIVPVSKVRHQAIIDYVNEFAKKEYSNAMVTEGSFASVLSRPTMLNFDVGIDKLPKKAFIDYMNEMITKTKLKAFIEQGVFGSKLHRETNIQYDSPWGYLCPKESRVEEGVFGHKAPVNAFIYSGEWAIKTSIKAAIENGNFAFKKSLNAFVFADKWLDKLPHLCYYSYDTWGAKSEKKIFVDPNEFASRKIVNDYMGEQIFAGNREEKHAILSFGDFAEKGINEAWYEECVFSDRLIRSSNIFQQIDWAFRDARKCDLHPDDFGNWAWVYESPDPFPYDKFGIDELLLPEKDTQYENFEDLIFDREHMRPRNAIKEISETQWIAKLPIRHPVGKYEDVGKVYEDSAVKWENYFGIQTSIIHSMFLRYYRIWEKNMFKFSTMTMQQAGNLMLEYLWSWIPDYYPIDCLEQAYRAFRLIRWYTECAIINNSQYIISYEYANLTWPDADHKGICHIPSDLQEYNPTDLINNSNDTMYSDIRPGFLCLRNNPIYTGSNDIWVTFRIKNKRNTTINLNLYNQTGSVNIYLNNKLIDVVTAHGSHKLAYNIQYTGFVNEFKIEKKAADNLDNNFIIGHISIANQSFKDLSIEFDPVLRAGNKPLNEVAEKLIAFASLHDRKDIAYHEMLTKNLGVSEVYKLLLKYWQLHHENKWKGKRLTIKQV